MIIHYQEDLKASVRALAEMALREDCPHQDVTVKGCGIGRKKTEARMMTRQAVVFAGALVIPELVSVFSQHHGTGSLECRLWVEDGQRCLPQDTLLTIEGTAAAVLALERPLLNFLGRSIGIATATRLLVDQVNASGCGAGIFDTRKTMPGYRFFDKYAVRCGGGHNHRMSLSDQVLLKENHIAKFGGVRGVLDAVRQELGPEIPVIIEVRSLAELLEAQEGPCDIIMLDNFSVGMIMEAIDRKNTGIQFEISGGITPANLHQFLIPGVDRLSVGSITHSVQAPDLTLLVTEEA